MRGLVPSKIATSAPNGPTVDMKLEVVVVPVSDLDRAKRSCSNSKSPARGWADRALRGYEIRATTNAAVT